VHSLQAVQHGVLSSAFGWQRGLLVPVDQHQVASDRTIWVHQISVAAAPLALLAGGGTASPSIRHDRTNRQKVRNVW
jgi:hypothetical protein